MPRNYTLFALIGGGITLVLALSTVLALAFGLLILLSSGRILPGVSVAGVNLGGMTGQEAAAALASELNEIVVADGDRRWRVPTAALGLHLDAQETAAAAQRYGRGSGSAFTGILGKARVAPVFTIDTGRAAQGVEALATTVNLPARNATIRMINGQLQPVPPELGRQLNVADTVARLATLGDDLADGAFDLAMIATYPTVTDATPLLEKTRALLASPLTINAFNPVTNQTDPWVVPVEEWGRWLTTENTPTGMALSLDGGALTNYLTAHGQALGEAQYLKVEESVKQVQEAISAGTPNATVRLYNKPTQYTVIPGDTLGTISWKVGVQMFRIERANPGVNLSALYAGQVIIIPSKDELLPLPVVFNKRIVVSISKQRVWAYENGQVKWEWLASTGIADSPTMPGVYQVQSHDGTAYASNWNLYMPYFMSIYEAVPGFYNGFHGFPSRGGSQILWENALGRPVTYGCILISSQNAKLLYEWAEEGVIVEIQT